MKNKLCKIFITSVFLLIFSCADDDENSGSSGSSGTSKRADSFNGINMDLTDVTSSGEIDLVILDSGLDDDD